MSTIHNNRCKISAYFTALGNVTRNKLMVPLKLESNNRNEVCLGSLQR